MNTTFSSGTFAPLASPALLVPDMRAGQLKDRYLQEQMHLEVVHVLKVKHVHMPLQTKATAHEQLVCKHVLA